MNYNITEQVSEVSLIQSMFYNDEFLWLDPVSDAYSQSVIEQFLQNSEYDIPEELHFEFKLRVDIEDMKEIAWLFVILPTHYPTVSPQIHISTSKLSREVQAVTNEVISEYLKAHIGESCIHEVYELVREKIQQLNNEGSIFHENPDNVKEEITSIKKERPKIGRALLWMHHIKNPNKRKDIVHWADELQLNGFSKPGYPGIVVVEGLDENVQEYISRLKALRWQAIAVRHKEFEYIDDSNKLNCHRKIRKTEGKPGVLEVQTMSEISAGMREAGLEEMFLSALKLQK